MNVSENRTYDCGKVGISLNGDYSSSINYEPMSLVRYDNKTWLSKSYTKGNTPANNSNYWTNILVDGETGEPLETIVMKMTLYAHLWEGTENKYYASLKDILETILGDDYNDYIDVNIDFDNDVATSAEKEAFLSYNMINFASDCVYAFCVNKPSVNIPIIMTITNTEVTPLEIA